MNQTSVPSLEGHRILITGGARGLGEAFVRACVAAGAQVALTDVLHERGEALAAALNQGLAQPVAHYLPMDVSDPLAIEQATATAVERLGGLDGLWVYLDTGVFGTLPGARAMGRAGGRAPAGIPCVPVRHPDTRRGSCVPARCLLQVYMTEHLIECGLYLFKYLRSLQVRTAARAPGPWLPSIGAPR